MIDQFKYGTRYLEHQNWDICITTSSDRIPIDKFNEIVSQENIITKASFYPRIQSNVSLNNKISKDVGIGTLADDSLDSLFHTLLPQETLMSYDKKLMSRKDAVVLPHSVAMEINAKVGDTVSIHALKTDEMHDFVLAAIYNDKTYMPFFKAVVLSGSFPSLETEPDYSIIFVDIRDMNTALKEIEKLKKDLEGSRHDNASRRTNKIWLEYRESQLQLELSLKVFNEKSIAFLTFFSISSLCLLFFNEKRKSLIVNRKAFGVLSAFEMKRIHYFTYMFASSYISQTFAFIVAALILNIFVYNPLDSFYFTRNLAELSPFFALAFAITSMVVAFLALWLIRKEKLMEALNQEV